jgi:hypothetical protein
LVEFTDTRNAQLAIKGPFQETKLKAKIFIIANMQSKEGSRKTLEFVILIFARCTTRKNMITIPIDR